MQNHEMLSNGLSKYFIEDFCFNVLTQLILILSGFIPNPKIVFPLNRFSLVLSQVQTSMISLESLHTIEEK